MEYQKIMNLLDNTPNQLSEFKKKNLVDLNDESRGTYNQIRLKTSMWRSSFCSYSDAYILAKGTITVTNTVSRDQPNNAVNKKVILKNFVSIY